MRYFILPHICLLLLLVLFSACNRSAPNQSVNNNRPQKTDSVVILDTTMGSSSSDQAVYFIVVADTGRNYYSLREKMMDLAPQLNIPIDTMNRYYNEDKDRIVLPDDAADEIYAGDYFPRIFPSESMSLEYLDFYKGLHIGKTIALLTGVYENASSSDSALTILKELEPSAFQMRTEMCMGCMH